MKQEVRARNHKFLSQTRKQDLVPEPDEISASKLRHNFER